MKVLITGATGFVGSQIVKKLIARGDQVNVLTRSVPRAAMKLGAEPDYFKWNPAKGPAPKAAFQEVDAVINLMGENISEGRWNDSQKRRIYDSRVLGTRNLVSTLNQSEVKIFLSTSAIGVYGDRPANEEVTEDTKIEPVDFLSKVCHDWEVEAGKAKSDLRSCILRVGVVLEKSGGAIAKMIIPFKMGVGGIMGDGKQVMSWIHREDLVNLYLECLDKDTYSGIVNATAPRPVTNKVFTHTLGKVLKRPTLFPVPSFAAKLAFGDMSVILLEGQKVMPSKALKQSFNFQYDTIQKALTNIL